MKHEDKLSIMLFVYLVFFLGIFLGGGLQYICSVYPNYFDRACKQLAKYNYSNSEVAEFASVRENCLKLITKLEGNK